jgi:ribose transport system substrate-binding protein
MKFRTIALTLALTLTSGISFAQTKKNYTIGLVAKSQGNPVFQAARVGAEQAAKELGEKHNLNIKIDWRTPNEEDAQKQAEAIEQLVLNGAHGIAVSCSKAPVYVDGELFTTLKGEGLVDEFLRILDEYVRTNYGRPDTLSPEQLR